MIFCCDKTGMFVIFENISALSKDIRSHKAKIKIIKLNPYVFIFHN